MELKQFAEELKLRMEAEIDTISADQADELRRTSMLIECVARYVGELKRYVVKYKFRSIKDETSFFKHVKPDFVSRLLYFRKLFNVQLFEVANPNETKLQFYWKQLQRIQRFLACPARHANQYESLQTGRGTALRYVAQSHRSDKADVERP